VSILCPALTPCKATRPHDADACGIEYATSCATCRARLWPEPEPTAWQRLCERYPVLLGRSGNPLHDPVPPEPFTEAEMARLVSTLHRPLYRELLRDVLADLLAEDITDIALAVAREADHAA
jgi:hypothetical protein